MNVLNQVRLVVYRINKKGLEIFLEVDQDQWSLPKGKINNNSPQLLSQNNMIELDPTEHEANVQRTLAVEGDWHDIPSIRGIIKQDVHIVKEEIKDRIPGLEKGKGTFVSVKDAVKKVMPEEYAYLKELKDIILDRNQTKYI